MAFSGDEETMGFGFPREERDALVASAPEIFFLPPTRDLRYQWVCARLAVLEDDLMRELVVDAWRMCVPKMLHELPELPEPVAHVWDLLDRHDLQTVRPLLHPYVHWLDGPLRLRGRTNVLSHLADNPTPRPPDRVQVRDGQVYRWLHD